MKSLLAKLAVLALLTLASAPLAAEVAHVDLDVTGYLCGL